METARISSDGFIYLNEKIDYRSIDFDNAIYTLKYSDKINVKMLQLYRKELEIVPESISLLTYIQRLGLNDNKIKYLPEWIGNFKYLRKLWIHNNELEILPSSIGDLINLDMLNIAGNRLKSLPSSMLSLTNLYILWLENNPRLPQHLQLNITSDHTGTQELLLEIALEERRVHTRETTIAWILGKKQVPIHRDVSNMISGMIWETQREDVWEKISNGEIRYYQSLKKIKSINNICE